jgi:hypothetical protein
MLILALLSVSLIWIDLGVFNHIIYFVWAVFVIDITVRIYWARSKLMYVLKHPFDIVSVIPLDSFFLLTRFSRFISVFRMRSILKRYTSRLQGQVSSFSLTKVTIGFLSVVIVLNLAVMLLMNSSLAETLRWSYFSMYVFDYGKGTGTWSILLITLALKVSYILYVGFLVNLLFQMLLHMETDLLRIYYRFRNKKDRLFYQKLSLTSKKHREVNGYNQQIISEIMKQFEEHVHKPHVQEAAIKNAERGLRSVYIKLYITYNPQLDDHKLEPNFQHEVRGLSYQIDTPTSSLILSPEDLTSTEGFKKMLRKFPFLDLHMSVYNAPAFAQGDTSWIEIRCYWEKYL